MYPVSLGFDAAEQRIQELIKNGHHAEALVTSVFTFEKTLRRSLRFCAVSRGFTSEHAGILFKNMGFNQLKEVWPCFERNHRSLSDFVGDKWQYVTPAVTMRNKLAHGERVYKLTECKSAAMNVLDANKDFRDKLISVVEFDGWRRLSVRRKSALQWLPGSPK